LRETGAWAGLRSREDGRGGAGRGLGGMDELAAGFVGLGIAFRGVGRPGVLVRLVERDASGVEDFCCVDVVGVGLG
jgi:hypothetical protein